MRRPRYPVELGKVSSEERAATESEARLAEDTRAMVEAMLRLGHDGYDLVPQPNTGGSFWVEVLGIRVGEVLTEGRGICRFKPTWPFVGGSSGPWSSVKGAVQDSIRGWLNRRDPMEDIGKAAK